MQSNVQVSVASTEMGRQGTGCERGEVFSRLRLGTRLRRAGPSTDDSGNRIGWVGHESGAVNKQESSASAGSGAEMRCWQMMLRSIEDEVCCSKNGVRKRERVPDTEYTHLDSHRTLPPTSSKQKKGPDAAWTRYEMGGGGIKEVVKRGVTTGTQGV